MIGGDNRVSGVLLENVKTRETKQFSTDGLFDYVGMDPASEFVKDVKIMDEENCAGNRQKRRKKDAYVN
ncbi:MAG TPA: hypothetical protein VNM45_06425 [Bacillus sp. (in: firmicutes)]|nr:hypothetical protein [Bacillus sp. (in: firmicutes)]